MNVQDVFKLSVAERILLAEAIWDSVAMDASIINPQHEAAWQKEIDFRMEKLQKGEVTVSSWQEVKNRMLQK